MKPQEVIARGDQLRAALATSEVDAPPEAELILDLVLGAAFNLAVLAHPPVVTITSGECA